MKRDGIVDALFKTTRQHAKALDESVRSIPAHLVLILVLTAGVIKTPETPERCENWIGLEITSQHSDTPVRNHSFIITTT